MSGEYVCEQWGNFIINMTRLTHCLFVTLTARQHRREIRQLCILTEVDKLSNYGKGKC
jgi:hypothetical protein